MSIQKDTDTHQAQDKLFAEVTVLLPVEGRFTYAVPESLMNRELIGCLVLVPFGRRRVSGVVVGITDDPGHSIKKEEIRDIECLLFEGPVYDREMIGFLRGVSDYYLYPSGEVFKLGLAPGMAGFSMLCLALTEEGRVAIKASATAPEHKKILELAKRHTPLQRALRLKGLTHSSILKLKEEGLIDIRERLKKAVLLPREEEFVRWRAPEESAVREFLNKTKARAVRLFIQFISEEEDMPISEARRHLRGLSAYLKPLEEAGFIDIYKKEIRRVPEEGLPLKMENVIALNSSQSAALNELKKGLDRRAHHVFLLHGITGSGKTEVYLKAMEHVLEQGRGVLFLVPELSLTPQQLQRLRSRFGDVVAVLHSGLSSGERFDEWRRLRTGKARIVIGARSAIFAPLNPLGLIVMDEEHDPSYKQEDNLRYNTRDMAILRAKSSNACVILGSATPSIESYYSATVLKEYTLLELPERVEKKPLPEVEIVDLRMERDAIISRRLMEAISDTLSAREQAILFLNRRGFAPFMLCPDCGYNFNCPNCSVSLVYHSFQNSLRCHYCNYDLPMPEACPECRGVRLRNFGWGTERVEAAVKRLFPDARTLRLDRDTAALKGSHSRAYLEMDAGRRDILIGTQMVTKGFHFPRVTLVGIILAEQGLHFPDFRATERTFQLLTQVAGRAGRGEKRGRVIIQTYDPEQPCIQAALRHDYHKLYNNEILYRQELRYPPFSRIAALRVSGRERSRVESACKRVVEVLHSFKEREGLRESLNILGPAPAALSRLKGMNRWLILLKADALHLLQSTLRSVKPVLEKELKGMRFAIDIDPQALI